jgi:FAD/FMN-containing dehydrogenase
MVQFEDASGFRGAAERVIVPRNEGEVVEAIRAAADLHVPLTIAGAGTGVTGGSVPGGGWVLSLKNFAGISVGQGMATAGAGALLRDLHAAAAATGQFYPPDPTETAASIGGTIATNASGSRSFRYGDTRRYVKRLRVATMDASIRDYVRGERVPFEIPRLPQPATTKQTAGYYLMPGMDWVDLFVGSEGTLGVVLEAGLVLLPAPAALLTGVVLFASDELALEFVDRTRPEDARMLEYLDRHSLDILRTRFAEIPREAAAALLLEVDIASEEDSALESWLNRLEESGALIEGSWFAASAADRERFRRFRHALPELVNDLVRRKGLLKMGSDFAVPRDRNREMLALYRARLEAEFASQYVIFGHIGDAHLHANILPANAAESARAAELMLEFAREAVRLGGTISAEHGLGKRKKHLLALQYAPHELEAMRSVKRRLDPQWLLGRGTLWD